MPRHATDMGHARRELRLDPALSAASDTSLRFEAVTEKSGRWALEIVKIAIQVWGELAVGSLITKAFWEIPTRSLLGAIA